MPEPKLISPLLDGFAMGAPISSHHGVRCCPAMKQDSNDKYIVKIISVPASQVQLEALLLTGAYKGPGDAMDYFKEVTDEIQKEADVLSKVAKLEGFLPYEDWQIVPMEDNKLGYHVYLLGTYKRSLERHLRKNPLTRLEAIRLGLDICRALAASRRCGSLYIDLKPSNIFLSDDLEFRIGDLGFVELNSVKFTSLPLKYRSPYSAPETLDALNTLNTTVDTYALGLILYQLFNNGRLPDHPESADMDYLPPVNSDPELTKILLKAIARNPEERWNSPEEMGKALGEYLDTGLASDDPIGASADPSADPEPAAEDPGNTQVFSTEAISSAITPVNDATQIVPFGQVVAAISGETQVVPTSQISSVVSGDTRVLPDSQTAPPLSGDAQVVSSFTSDGSVSSETKVIPIINDTPNSPVAVMEKTSIDSIPESVKATASKGKKPPKRERRKKKLSKKWIIIPILLVILAAVGYAGLYYYQNYYLQTIDSLTVDGKYDQMTVFVETEVDDSLLLVTCTDTYGNSKSMPLDNGQAVFMDLLPNSQYKISVDIDGNHKLVGKTSDVFNTESRTEIVSFSGITASESGSVLLTFTVEGPEPDEWILTYFAEGETPIAQSFTGHSVTVKDLVVPKVYTFTLTPSTEMFLTGQTSIEFAASALVMAQNLTITSCKEGQMTIHWDRPDNHAVEDWTVRVYSDNGYDKTQFTVDNEIVFDGIDSSSGYYVEVTANDMTQPARASITANPITIEDFQVNEEDPGLLTVTWEHQGEAPENGWLLMYSLDGSMTQNVVKCEGPSAVIAPRLHSSEYRFVIQAADSTSIFDNIYTYQCPDAEPFSDHSFNVDNTTAFLLVTPERENWNNGHVSENDYTDTFTVGQNISILLYCESRFFIPDAEIEVLYVIRNGNGEVMLKYIAQEKADWHDLWVDHSSNYAELDLPAAPQEPGDYSLSIYFNNKAIAFTRFSIVE